MSGKTTFKDRSMADRWDVITLQVENLHLQILPGIGGRLWDVKFHSRSFAVISVPIEINKQAIIDTREFYQLSITYNDSGILLISSIAVTGG